MGLTAACVSVKDYSIFIDGQLIETFDDVVSVYGPPTVAYLTGRNISYIWCFDGFVVHISPNLSTGTMSTFWYYVYDSEVENNLSTPVYLNAPDASFDSGLTILHALDLV